MKFHTTDELNTFLFEGAVLNDVETANGRVKIILDNVTILPENSCNRDVRKMRANAFCITFTDGGIIRLVEEGYKVFDADGNLRQTVEDRDMSEEEIQAGLRELADLEVYEISREEDRYIMIVDGEDHSFRLEIRAEHDYEEWNKFLSIDSM
ncbi:MAG: subtilin biosynthesis sensor protein SpaK [Lachnospiraceae bacterium]|nr:subtilin biosynthesis sensor protein SpaK [Lachnospiraceae bacterium]